jgi:hypothetical protein
MGDRKPCPADDRKLQADDPRLGSHAVQRRKRISMKPRRQDVELARLGQYRAPLKIGVIQRPPTFGGNAYAEIIFGRRVGMAACFLVDQI